MVILFGDAALWMQIVTPLTQDVNWTYIWRMSYYVLLNILLRLIYVLCPTGNNISIN